MRLPALLAAATVTCVSFPALAEDGPPPVEAEPAPSPDGGSDADEARFRGGVALGGGGLVGSISQTVTTPVGSVSGSIDVSGGVAGVDGHVGVQINDLIGVYFVPQIGGGSLSVDTGFAGVSVSEGWITLAGTAIVDFTFIDQVFVGAGGGFAVHGATCTNCDLQAGGAIHFRAGGYPWMDFGDDGIRRQGLMVAADVRLNFLASPFNTGTGDASMFLAQPMVTVGYEVY